MPQSWGDVSLETNNPHRSKGIKQVQENSTTSLLLTSKKYQHVNRLTMEKKVEAVSP